MDVFPEGRADLLQLLSALRRPPRRRPRAGRVSDPGRVIRFPGRSLTMFMDFTIRARLERWKIPLGTVRPSTGRRDGAFSARSGFTSPEAGAMVRP